MCNNKTFHKHIKSKWKMKKTMGSLFKEGKNDSLGNKYIHVLLWSYNPHLHSESKNSSLKKSRKEMGESLDKFVADKIRRDFLRSFYTTQPR